MIAAGRGDVEAVRNLLCDGYDVNQFNQYGHSALHIASHRGHLAIVRLLLDHYASIDQLNNNRRTLLKTPS